MTDLQYYQDMKNDMVSADSKRDVRFKEYEDIYHNVWELPLELKELEWVREVKDTRAYAAVATGVKVLSSVEPRIKFHPLAGNQETKKKANGIERNLLWQLYCANSRREATVENDMVTSALLYMAIVANVVDLDYQIAQMDLFKGNTKRLKALRRYGRFAVNTFNPRVAHFRRSGFMPEAVVLVQKKTAAAILDEWGELASELQDSKYKNAELTYCDLMDYDVRVVWIEGTKKELLILPKKNWEHKMPFLPWIATMGGSTLEDEAIHKYKPMLYSVYASNQHKTANIALSLAVSDTLARSSYPRYAEEGPNQEQTTKIDYTDPARIAKVAVGNKLVPLPPEVGDPHLWQIVGEMGAKINEQTLANVLMSGEVAPGTAFASLNLQTQTAIGSLKPAKRLAEAALSEMFRNMLLWTHYTKKDLYAYGRDEKVDLGEEYILAWDEIDPEALYIDVELTPDEATDRAARINAASIAVNSFGMSKERAMEEAGITDPQAEMEQAMFERVLEHKVQLILDAQRLEMEGAMQTKTMAMQQQIQMQMQQAQQGGMPPGAEGQPAPGMPVGEGGLPGGQGMNTGQGGMPPQMMQPDGTREMQALEEGQNLLGAQARGMGEMMRR